MHAHPDRDLRVRVWLSDKYPLINVKVKNDYFWAQPKDVEDGAGRRIGRGG